MRTPNRLPWRATPTTSWRAIGAAIAGLGVTTSAACGEPAQPAVAPQPERTAAPAPTPPPPNDALACARRREHERACPSVSPANAELLGKVCLSERACLEAAWTPEAVSRYMTCRIDSACGTDCQREVTRATAPGETLKAAIGQCQKACAGGDGASICDSVLGKFTPWSASAQGKVAQCFATTTDCFEALSCARTAASGPTSELGGCLGKAVARACLDGGDAPMCREMHELLKSKRP